MKVFMCLVSAAIGLGLPMISPAVAQDTSSWIGPYVGINAGYAVNGNSFADKAFVLRGSEGSLDDPDDFDTIDRHTSNSFVGGVQAGYNFQLGSFIAGVETDFNFTNLRDRQTSSYTASLYVEPSYEYHLSESFNVDSKVDWFGTLRVKVGALPTDRLMVYATGGLAYGHVTQSSGYSWREHGYWWGGPGDHYFDRSDSMTGSSKSVRAGWTAGIGGEYKLTDQLSLKAEYLHVDLRKKSQWASFEDGYAAAGAKDNARFDVVRVGLNYRF